MVIPRVLAAVVAASAVAGCTGGAMTFYEENDDLSLRGQRDRYYTQGARVSRVFPSEEAPQPARDVAGRIPMAQDEAVRSIGLVAGQNIYTPRRLDVSTLQRRDRPYAGWLYAGLVVADQKLASADPTDDDQQSVEVDLGVTGDASLARKAMDWAHQLTGSVRPEGWDHQIKFEPGLVVSYERRHRVVDEEPLGLGFDVLPTYGGSVGNVDTHLGGGGIVRLGLNLPRDFGVNTLSTTAMETGSSARSGASFYLFGSGEGRGVARNLLLDGNTFRPGPPRVDKKLAVGEFRGGLALQYKAFRFTYTWITRSPEFNGQHGWTRFGSVSLGLFLDF